MSSISAPTASPPPYTPPTDNRRTAAKADQAAEKTSAKVSELTATAVAAQSVKESNKGTVLDIRV